MTPRGPAMILVILNGALGDFVLALPALMRLRSRFPGRTIHLAGNPSWLPLAQETLAVDRTFSAEALPLHEGFQPSLSPRHRLFRFLSGYDLILSWFGDREGRFQNNLHQAFPGRARCTPFHRQAAFPGHVGDFYLDTLRTWGLAGPGGAGGPSPWPLALCWDPHRSRGSWLCIHPGSGSAAKNWDPDRFRAVANHVQSRWNMPVRVLLGPAEEERRGPWESTAIPLTVLRGLSLCQVARCLAQGALYLGNDSGVTHLAASLGVPTLALFGPTDPRRWAPRGPRVHVLRHSESPPAPSGAPRRDPDGTAAARPAMEAEAALLALRALLDASMRPGGCAEG